jgi:hypothetical protein
VTGAAPSTAPRRSSRCAWQTLDGEAVLLDLEGRRVMGLNPVGSFVWELLDGQRTVEDLAAAVAARFGADPARAGQDVRAFLATLRERGLVELES